LGLVDGWQAIKTEWTIPGGMDLSLPNRFLTAEEYKNDETL
jgi:hypothetical protein